MKDALRSFCMTNRINLIVFLALVFASLCCQPTFGQSCGGGKSYFHVFDESDAYEIKDVYISLHIVDENQDWRTKNFSKFGWKRQIFDDKTAKKYTNSKTHSTFETAFEIPFKEQSRLVQNWIKLAEKYPTSIFAEDKDRCGN